MGCGQHIRRGCGRYGFIRLGEIASIGGRSIRRGLRRVEGCDILSVFAEDVSERVRRIRGGASRTVRLVDRFLPFGRYQHVVEGVWAVQRRTERFGCRGCEPRIIIERGNELDWDP
jgi:hypothetical protein